MLNNFIYAQSKAMFEERLHEVPNDAIVFIEDTKEIWNHGHYFAGEGVDPAAFSNLESTVAENNAQLSTIDSDISDLQNNKVDKIFIGNDTEEHWNNIQRVIDEGVVCGPCKFYVNDNNYDAATTFVGTYLCVTPYGSNASDEGDYMVTMIGHAIEEDGVHHPDYLIQFNIWTNGQSVSVSNNKLLSYSRQVQIGDVSCTKQVRINSAETIALYTGDINSTNCDMNITSYDNINFRAGARIDNYVGDVQTGDGFNFKVGKYGNLFVGHDSSNYCVIPNVRAWNLGSTTYPFDKGYFNSIYATSVYQTSDEKLKNFEGKIKIDFDKLASLKKHYFTWKEGDNKELQIGVSAQEIQELYPELVSTNGDKLTVAYDKLAVVALAAIDELHEENKQLRKELDELKDTVNVLKERIWGTRE